MHLVAAGLGIAIVPRWTARLAVEGVAYVPLVIPKTTRVSQLPLAAVWMRDSRDVLRDALLQTLMGNIDRYASKA